MPGTALNLYIYKGREDSQVGRIPWRRAWRSTPVFSPGESHGQRSLVGYSPQGFKVKHNWSNFVCTQALEQVFSWPRHFLDLLFSFFSWKFSWKERVVYISLFPPFCYLLTPCDLLSVPISKSNDNFSTVTLLVLGIVIYIIGTVLSWNSPLCSLQSHSLSVSISFQCFPVVFSDTRDSDSRARLASSLFSAVMASGWHILLFHTCNISHNYTLSKITSSRTTEVDEYHFLLTPFLSSFFPNNMFASWDFQIILQSVPKFSFSSSYL